MNICLPIYIHLFLCGNELFNLLTYYYSDMNYADLNPTVSYNSYYSNNTNDYSYDKYQEGVSMFKKGQSYYCGGNAGLSNPQNLEMTSLRKMYFSQENIDRLQKKIRKEIKRQSDGKYTLEVDQDETDLTVAMDAVFERYARHLPNQIIRQVKELNQHTLDYIIPDMLTNIRQASTYVKRLNEPIKPIDRPLNVNGGSKGTLPSFTSVWGF